jgi:hypothetical protein
MTTILPEGEEIRKAVKWISEMRQAEPGTRVEKLIESASVKFDLSPIEADFLTRFCKEQ